MKDSVNTYRCFSKTGNHLGSFMVDSKNTGVVKILPEGGGKAPTVDIPKELTENPVNIANFLFGDPEDIEQDKLGRVEMFHGKTWKQVYG